MKKADALRSRKIAFPRPKVGSWRAPAERRWAISTFVVIEGSNGTGKSEIAQHLRQAWAATSYHFPPGFDQVRWNLGLDTGMPAVPRLMYYLASCAHLSSLIERDLEVGQSVVCDRYSAAPLSLLVAEAALPEELVGALAGPCEEFLVKPDLTLLLTAEHAVAVERITRRSIERRAGALTPVEERCVRSPAFFQRRAELLRHYSCANGPVLELDTSRITQAEALNSAEHAIHSFLATRKRHLQPVGPSHRESIVET